MTDEHQPGGPVGFDGEAIFPRLTVEGRRPVVVMAARAMPDRPSASIEHAPRATAYRFTLFSPAFCFLIENETNNHDQLQISVDPINGRRGCTKHDVWPSPNPVTIARFNRFENADARSGAPYADE